MTDSFIFFGFLFNPELIDQRTDQMADQFKPTLNFHHIKQLRPISFHSLG